MERMTGRDREVIIYWHFSYKLKTFLHTEKVGIKLKECWTVENYL